MEVEVGELVKRDREEDMCVCVCVCERERERERETEIYCLLGKDLVGLTRV